MVTARKACQKTPGKAPEYFCIASFVLEFGFRGDGLAVHRGVSKFGFSAMTFAHVGYITKFLWGQRHPPRDSEVE